MAALYADTWIPTEKELTTQEVTLSSPYLRAAAHHLGIHCDEQSKEFMLCKEEEKDPRKCIEEGKIVTACALEFFRALKQNCRDEFEQYAHCLDFSSKTLEFRHCRKTQAVYDRCMLENLKLERAEFGYFCRPRIHHTKRPKPEPEKPREYPDPTPALPKDYPTPPAVYGSRWFNYE